MSADGDLDAEDDDDEMLAGTALTSPSKCKRRLTVLASTNPHTHRCWALRDFHGRGPYVSTCHSCLSSSARLVHELLHGVIQVWHLLRRPRRYADPCSYCRRRAPISSRRESDPCSYCPCRASMFSRCESESDSAGWITPSGFLCTCHTDCQPLADILYVSKSRSPSQWDHIFGIDNEPIRPTLQ